MADGRLILHERYRIHVLHAAGLSLRAIGRELDRVPSTISRELRAQALIQAGRSNASARPRIDAQCIGRIEAYLQGDSSPHRSLAGLSPVAFARAESPSISTSVWLEETRTVHRLWR